jgi:hypothetical protein
MPREYLCGQIQYAIRKPLGNIVSKPLSDIELQQGLN